MRRMWLVAGVALALAVPSLLAQQQAAEAPASDRRVQTRPAVAGLHGLVTTGHPISSSAGLQILIAGGNAFDAAVAVGLTAAMAEPEMNGIGGNGFAMLYDAKSATVLSLSMAGAAPKAVVGGALTADELNAGMKAGIVPGNLGGYLALLDRFGTRSIAEVSATAIAFAERGYPIEPPLAENIARGKANLSKYPTTARLFLPGGLPLKAGDMFRNPDYAATLRKLVEAERRALEAGASRSGAIRAAHDRFYTGDIAQEIDQFFRANGGLLTAADLAAFRPTWSQPLHATYRGFDVYGNISTSRGGYEVLMQANLVEATDLRAAGAGSAGAVHAVVEAIKVAKSDVYRYVADPLFTTIPTTAMLSKAYAAQRRALIDPARAGVFPEPGTPGGVVIPAVRGGGAAGYPDDYDPEQHTTSFSIVDRFGNAIGVTPTLGGLFGNNVVVGTTGLLLNNGMRLGSTSPYPGDANFVGGGKVPILNNSPILVLEGGKVRFVFGTPGGETIGQTQFQVLVNLIDFAMPVQQAIEAPRVALVATPNFYKPGAAVTVQVESRLPPATIEALRAMGHTIDVLPGWGSIGHVQAIRIDPVTGAMTAGADPRRTGYAMGY
ncbi:MAG: gamma-glutamyltransferase family protein [Acidobacteria bacterium]|nr:gamma-glutamyltransferase family protein [Acidobacteriota bacterium]